MRVWDIVDEVHPGVQITTVHTKPPRFTGSITSSIRVAVAVVFVVASSANFNVARPEFTTGPTAQVRVVLDRPPVRTALSRSQHQRVVAATDTQFGQSTLKLSQAFAAYFQPAPNEDDYEDDYSFE